VRERGGERERGREGGGREREREREREMGGHSFKKPNCKDHANLEKRRI
jgi:hypothetical protein